MITFRKGSNTISVDLPLWGYSVDIHMQLHLRLKSDGSPTMWDDGVTDTRICRATFTNGITAMQDLAGWVRNYSSSRGESFSMELGGTPTGFYPFGPDWGDVGTFTVRVADQKQGGWLIEPYNWAQNELQLVCVDTAGAYSWTEYDEGSLEIGDVDGLRWPEGGFVPEVNLGLSTAITRTGAPHTLDESTYRDQWYSAWTQVCNQGKASALVAELVSKRGGDTTIVGPVRNYTFGIEQQNGDGDGIYTANLAIGNEQETVLTCTHVGYNRWEIPLRYWMQEAVGA